MENLKRAHIYAAIWQNSLIVNAPTFNPIDYGRQGILVHRVCYQQLLQTE